MPLEFCIPVPVGAWHDLLPACLESLVIQKRDLGDHRLNIALLDASGDDRVRALAEQYDADLYWRRHGPDGGQSDAIIEGWDKVPGDILGWLNADDLLFPGALKKIADRFEAEPETDVVYGQSTIINRDLDMVGYHWSVEPPGPRLLESGIISQPSCLFRRSACEAVGGLDRDLHYTMDWDLWIRMYEASSRFAFLDDVLSMVLWDEDTKTASFNDRRRAELRSIIERHSPPEKADRIFRSFAIHNALDRIRPAFLRKTITRLLVRGRKEIFGLAGDGRIAGQATLHLVHFNSAPLDMLDIDLEKVPASLRLETGDGTRLDWHRTGSGVSAPLPGPLAAGETLTLNVSSDGTAPLWFMRAGLA